MWQQVCDIMSVASKILPVQSSDHQVMTLKYCTKIHCSRLYQSINCVHDAYKHTNHSMDGEKPLLIKPSGEKPSVLKPGRGIFSTGDFFGGGGGGVGGELSRGFQTECFFFFLDPITQQDCKLDCVESMPTYPQTGHLSHHKHSLAIFCSTHFV